MIRGVLINTLIGFLIIAVPAIFCAPGG